MQINKKYILVFLLGCLLFSGCQDKNNPAQQDVQYSITKSFNNGPLLVNLKISSKHIKLSDLLDMEIQTQINADYIVDLPKIKDDLKDFAIHTQREIGKKLGANNSVITTYYYKLEPIQTGKCQIPQLQFPFRKASEEPNTAKWDVLRTEAVDINVTTQSPIDANTSMADIEDVVDVKTNHLLAVVITFAAVILCAVGYIIYKMKTKKQEQIQKVYRPAHEIAFEMLRKLAGEKLVEQGRIKEYYEKLSSCLRKYIEDRFTLRAPEQTTEEFLDEIKKSNVLEPRYKQELKNFLEHCDLVKFAKYQPTNEQINQSLTMAQQFVDNTKSQEHQVEV
ncbi:MAG: hypothetical protein A2Y12_15010 [Planctomycetes bacterium GWF2_42_9]|nr:MAG: hypothetical protein A2Y12_15010 [Planctomycetes bacterium GWF2_42_9]